MDTIEIETLDAALEAESKARKLVVAIGEEWKALHEANREPTEEELSLHKHLVQKWRKAAQVVAEAINEPEG